MQRTPRETSPRTAEPTQPGDIHRAGFESVLPPDVFDELVAPRRPRILGRPVKGPPRWRVIAALVILALALAAGVVVALWSWQRPSAPPATVPPAPVAPIQSPAAVDHVVEQPILPPRAQLVKLPTPRATLVALPEWHVGETRRLLMPYGLEVIGRLRGHSEDELYLPASGNVIGDTWLVENTPWIWLVAPGAATAEWLDP